MRLQINAKHLIDYEEFAIVKIVLGDAKNVLLCGLGVVKKFVFQFSIKPITLDKIIFFKHFSFHFIFPGC